MTPSVVMMSTMLNRPQATDDTLESGADSLPRRDMDVDRLSTLSAAAVASSKVWSSSAVRLTSLYDSIHPLPVVTVGGDSVPIGVVVCGFGFVVVRGSCGGSSVDKVKKKTGVECVACSMW